MLGFRVSPALWRSGSEFECERVQGLGKCFEVSDASGEGGDTNPISSSCKQVDPQALTEEPDREEGVLRPGCPNHWLIPQLYCNANLER